VERLLGRLRKLDRKARALGLENVRCVRIEAAYFLEYLLPPGTAQAIHVYFPDPWPKRRHHKHRLVNARFVELAPRALAPGGLVHLRTDDAAYFEVMKSVFGASPAFAEATAPEALESTLTDFERDFLSKGTQTLRLTVRRVR
jgi:tRNA (guanine-N7-)-methyltransferase